MLLLEFASKKAYNLIEESKIITECGALYKAQDLELNRTIAIKMVEILGKNEKERTNFYEKARLEVQALVSLGEENLPIPVVHTTYYDEKNAKFYIMMDWIKGTTLATHMKVHEMKFLQWMMELCDILSAMEKKRIYHKDIKPSNIIINHKDKLFLIDFNISISTPNLVEGTVNYKAPEMSLASKYVGREKVDMFSVGVMLYEYYTGIVPVRGREYAKNSSRGKFEWDKFISPKEKNDEICDDVETIILKCMKLDPKQRYRNYGELKRDLEKAMRGIRWAKMKK